MENLNKLEAELSQMMKVYNPPLSENEQIIMNVCKALDVEYNDVIGPLRNRDLLEARKIACTILRETHTLYAIGKLFNRDHATVMWALKSYKDLMSAKDKEFMAKVKRVNDEMEAICV